MADPQHGTRSRYINHGCRCDDCRKANSLYSKNRHHRLMDAYRQQQVTRTQQKPMKAPTPRATPALDRAGELEAELRELLRQRERVEAVISYFSERLGIPAPLR